MHSQLSPQESARRTEIDGAIRETREAIEEALGYIERQEDGPVTMHHALQDIDACVDVLETELCDLRFDLEKLNRIAAKLREQRDEAVRQRDVLLLHACLNGRS